MDFAQCDVDAYYERFEIDEQRIEQVMATALSQGGDYCDLYFQQAYGYQLSLEDNAVNQVLSNVVIGVGVRVLKGDQTGYAYTELITPESMRGIARAAAQIAADGKRLKAVNLAPVRVANLYPARQKPEDIEFSGVIRQLQEINERIFRRDSRVIKANVQFSAGSSHILIATSEGRVACDYRPMINAGAHCVAEYHGRREQSGFSLASSSGIEFMTAENGNRLADEAVARTMRLFEAVKPEAGEMEVVLAAGSSGILLHEAIGHGLEADFNRKRISIFTDRMNQAVAGPLVSIVDDGTLPHERGSLNIDDEANPAGKTVLVENGVLKSFLHDRISALHYAVAPTGNGRRQSFQFPPLPRMRNTYMLPGPHTAEEIIRDTRKGIYAETFTNGEVSVGGGDFTFYIKSGSIIENGKLTYPVKDVNIIGSGPQVLQDIVMVGDDLEMAEGGWMCGKNGQSVPVSMGLPTVKVARITVGGVNRP